MFREVVAIPLAQLMTRSRSVIDLVPLLSAKPWFAMLSLRDYLFDRGYEPPSGGKA